MQRPEVPQEPLHTHPSLGLEVSPILSLLPSSTCNGSHLMQRKSPASQQPTRLSVHVDMRAHVHTQFYMKNTLTTHTDACRHMCPLCVHTRILA